MTEEEREVVQRDWGVTPLNKELALRMIERVRETPGTYEMFMRANQTYARSARVYIEHGVVPPEQDRRKLLSDALVFVGVCESALNSAH